MDEFTGPPVAARVRRAKPYDPVSSLQAIRCNRGITHYKLDWNESTIEPSPKVGEALQRLLGEGRSLHWYPDPGHEELCARLSAYVGCPPEHLLVTNGSDDALALVCQTYIDAGDEVVAPFPTYRHFLQFAELANAAVQLIRKDCPFSFTCEDIEAALTRHSKIVYLANPNNPTGTLLDPEAICRLAGRYPGILFLVDEAYYEFSGRSCAGRATALPNMVVTRSFSKCFGLAGLRVGYLVAAGPIIATLRRAHNPKSINRMAQVGAAAALDDLPYYRRYVAALKQSAAMTRAFCDENRIPCRLSHANFVLLCVDDPVHVAARLREAGVHVRDRSSQLPGMIRITLGTPDQMRDVLQRLGRVLSPRSEPQRHPRA